MSAVQNGHDRLKQGAQALGLSIDPTPYLAYIELLCKWNQTYNLTAIRDPETMLYKHVLDSLAIAPFIQGDRILDVGSGAGLPGIPLAIHFSQKTFVLLDSLGKKTRFLDMVCRTLGLTHVEVVQNRVEHYRPAQPFDTVTARGLSSLQQFVEWTKPCITEGGIWLAMKGCYPEAELAALNRPYTVHPLKVPGVEGERCVVCIQSRD